MIDSIGNLPKRALVTGASGLIGGAIAERLLDKGYSVSTPSHGLMPMESPLAIEDALLDCGPIDVLVAAHGTIGCVGKALTSDWDNWLKAISVNLLGTMHLLRCVVPKMRAGAQVIVMSGGGGMLTPLPMLSSYACSKAALTSLVKTLSEELEGVRINAIFPGMQASRIHDPIIAAGEFAAGDEYRKVMRLRETGEGAVAIEHTLFLVDYLLSSKVTGECLFARTIKARLEMAK